MEFFNISKYAGPVKVFALKEFHNFAHTITAAQVHCAPSTGYLLRSVICLQPMARPLAFIILDQDELCKLASLRGGG
ncbi:MAG: hypothetical protein DMG86_23415 [Acidobacteria bacterium]|nr:MAG: hypothetical protein DMG86_23415 [Acidobacteriota bacterium]